jgi:hypothetical protein
VESRALGNPLVLKIQLGRTAARVKCAVPGGGGTFNVRRFGMPWTSIAATRRASRTWTPLTR